MYNNYLQHHGVQGQRWGFRRFQPYPKGHKGGIEVGEAARPRFFSRESRANRINTRGTKKLTKMDRKVEAGQKKADKYYEKAIKKSNSVFSSQKGVSKAIAKANSAQRSVNRLESKGSKYYQRKAKKLGRMDSAVNEQFASIGKRYLNNVAANSRSMYNAMLTSSGTIQYRR